MKWFFRILKLIRKIFAMTNLPVIPSTNLIDTIKVHNVSLHFDGVNYYYTAIVGKILVFISYSNDLKNWFQNSGIYVVDTSAIWEMEIPEEKVLVELENIPSTTIKSKFKK